MNLEETMTELDAVRAYRERLLDLVVNRSDVRMDGAVQYVPRGKETLEIFDAAIAELQAVIERLGKERDEVEAMVKLAAKNEICCPPDTFECGEDADKCESCVIEGWRRKVAQRVTKTEEGG